MPIGAKITGDAQISGRVYAGQGYNGLTRSDLAQEDLVEYPILPHEWRTWDALATNLPGTAANDDLGLVTGTFGTDFPYIWAGDLKNAGATTRRAAVLLELPPEYVTGQDVRIRLFSGMKTTVASVSATIDVECYASAGTGVPTGSPTDLCQTAAQSINSLTEADKDFVIDASLLSAGDVLLVRVSIAVDDSATGTAVDAWVPHAAMLLDIKG